MYIPDSDTFEALKRLQPYKSVGLDKLLSFAIEGLPVLKNALTLSLSQRYFTTAWKQAETVPIFKKQKRQECRYDQLQTHLDSNKFFQTI
jgi:hypothetical protein